MASISFLATSPNSFVINHLSGSGVAFMGSAFGDSVDVAAYQTTSWISDGNGVNNGGQINNIKWLNTQSGILNSASSGIPLISMPNYLATLNIHFNHTSAVRTQNTKLYIYDRASINNNPSGVVCKVAELIHPNITQYPTGSGSQVWLTPAGSSYMTLTNAPGVSGLSPNGPSTTHVDHDWYIALSASPSSIGSKTQFGLYISTEYL